MFLVCGVIMSNYFFLVMCKLVEAIKLFELLLIVEKTTFNVSAVVCTLTR